MAQDRQAGIGRRHWLRSLEALPEGDAGTPARNEGKRKGGTFSAGRGRGMNTFPKCKQCGASMIHSRLDGYYCPRRRDHTGIDWGDDWRAEAEKRMSALKESTEKFSEAVRTGKTILPKKK
jgi:hypothetical protein